MKISRAAGRTVRVKYLVGSSKCLSRLKTSPKISLRGIFKEAGDAGGGVFFKTPPLCF